MTIARAITVIIKVIIIISALLFIFWKAWFCRKPRRSIPYGQEVIASPADGKVAVIRKYDSERLEVKKWNLGAVELLARDVAIRGWFVLIVMTPLNVHYQRAPVTGRVISVKHIPGKFLNAVKDADKLLALQNERNEILIDGKNGRLKVVQIAGMLARRISCFVARGQMVEKGRAIGFINLGSQVALILPENVEIKVKKGDKVVDGESVIGIYGRLQKQRRR